MLTSDAPNLAEFTSDFVQMGKFFQGYLPRTTWEDWIAAFARKAPWTFDKRVEIPWADQDPAWKGRPLK